MSKAVKENFDRDRDLQAYIEKIPEIFTMVQNLSTKAPMFDVDGSRLPVDQPGQVLQQKKTVAIISSMFERNPDKEAPIIGRRRTSIDPVTPEPIH